MKKLLKKVQRDFPALSFQAGQTFCWSPKQQLVSFSADLENNPQTVGSLLHEVAHATLKHHGFSSDLELLQLEVAAWQRAAELAAQYGYEFDSEHAQDCLDSYRDWLHRRSTCPMCGSISPQEDGKHYHCFNCDTIWQVSSARFCRPYRRLATRNK